MWIPIEIKNVNKLMRCELKKPNINTYRLVKTKTSTSNLSLK